ncbi:hypothetical protein JAAARDRAFT_190429 [Jaapia argillacea MUCL 33604]|uniref:Uncharacterized protein n=1 Tax=Jaapia argillacea MUCL 33604 TaxID=933084 RepID=A0A067QDW9_9AGAM|nr:hypothetical protein JAAARDRAFT_190429 [Jaapia argillacea MUCL 33604]
MVDGPFPTFPRRRLKLWRSATGKIRLEKFVRWVASLEDAAKQVYIREISWVKEPRFPSHEYILLPFGDKSNPDTIYDTTLRLERDTDSWFKIFGSWFGSNCRDTVSMWSSSLAAQHSNDRQIAHIAVNRTDIDIRYIAILLEVIGKTADEYRVWSYNCWWYAGCLWRNLVRCIGSNHCRFQVMHREGQIAKFAEFLAESRMSSGVDEWDAVTFFRFQTFSHLAAVERAAWSNSELEAATKYIEEIFELQVSGKLKGQFSLMEGFQKTPASPSSVNEAMAEFGGPFSQAEDLQTTSPAANEAMAEFGGPFGQAEDLQTTPPAANMVMAESPNIHYSPSPCLALSAPLPLNNVVDATHRWRQAGIVRSVHDAAAVQEFETLAWMGPIYDGRYRIQHLHSGLLVHVPGIRDSTPLCATFKLYRTTVWEVTSGFDGTQMFTCGANRQRLHSFLRTSRYYHPMGDMIIGYNFLGSKSSTKSNFTVGEIKDRPGIYTISPTNSKLFCGLSDAEEDTAVSVGSIS